MNKVVFFGDNLHIFTVYVRLIEQIPLFSYKRHKGISCK